MDKEIRTISEAVGIIKVEIDATFSSPDLPVATSTRSFIERNEGQLPHKRYRGLVLAVFSPIFFAIQCLFLSILTTNLDSFQVVFMHTPVFEIVCTLLLLYARVRPPRDYKVYLWLLGSGSAQAANTCFMVLAFSFLSVGDAVALAYTALIQVIFLSWIVLKEPMKLLHFVFALMALAGVFFVARPPFIFGNSEQNEDNNLTLLGVLFALAGSLALALITVLNKKLSRLEVNSYFCLFCNALTTVICSGILSLILQRWSYPTAKEWMFAMIAGVSYVGGHFTFFYSLKLETATLVTVISTTQIVYTFVLQVAVLHSPPFWASYIGAVLILAASIGITLNKKVYDTPQSQ